MLKELSPLPPVPVGMAAEIANLDRRRFNEAVADGSYPCAPETRSRQRRHFDEADVLGMCAFERLFHCTLSKAEAGRMACAVVSHYRDAERDGGKVLVRVVFPSGIQHRQGIPFHNDFDGAAIHQPETEAEFVGIEVRVGALVDAIRARYRHMVAGGSVTSADLLGDDA